MYQVLLVDDELVSLRTIQWILPWETLQVSRVISATSADEAKLQLQNYQIDLVICDVEMPGTDGLTFARWIRENHPDIAVIMLTCHQDFSFVQQSLRTGCLDYILKPATAEVLSDSVKRALELIGKRRSDQVGIAAREYTERERKKQLYYELLREIVEKPNIDVKSVVREFGLDDLLAMRCRPVIIRIQRWLEQFDDEDDLLLRYGVYNAAQDELFDEEDGGTALRIDRDWILLVLHGGNIDANDAYDRCAKLMERCSVYLNCELSCYVGRSAELEHFGEKYRELLENAHKYGATQTIYAVEWSDNWGDFRDWSVYRAEWLDMLKQQRYSSVVDYIREIIVLLEGEKTLDQASLTYLHQEFLGAVTDYLAVHQLQMDALGDPEQCTNKPCTTSDEILRWASELLHQVKALIESIYQEDELIQRIREFITVHINEDLDRESIAKAVYLTPDYLSRIFKKRTGMGLTKYIVNRRIELACQLLTQTNMSVGSIAVELGYSSFSHFSKIFKQQVGQTPAAYRKEKETTN